MDDTAIYYTLSTIAQTLAGALAILVAVVLFKLAALNTSLSVPEVDARGQKDFRKRPEVLDEWGRINARLYTVLGLSLADIVLCFLALPFTPRIARSWAVSVIIVCSAVGLGILSLIAYIVLIFTMVRRPPP